MKRILVTGTKGFIGHNFLRKSSRENFRLFEFENNLEFWNANLYQSLFVNSVQNNNPDVVIHFGAIASTGQIREEEIYGFNVDAVRIITEICTSENIPLVFISSAAVYGNKNNFSVYAKTKMLAEQVICNSANLKFNILRLVNTYGFNEIKKGDMKSVLSDMIISSLINKKIEIWKIPGIQPGTQSRDFVHVDDVVRIISQLVSNEIFLNYQVDLGTGDSYKFTDIAKIIISQIEGTSIEFKAPPKYYDFKEYQIHTCADISWMEKNSISIVPQKPSETIPNLVKKYSKLLQK